MPHGKGKEVLVDSWVYSDLQFSEIPLQFGCCVVSWPLFEPAIVNADSRRSCSEPRHVPSLGGVESVHDISWPFEQDNRRKGYEAER
jgi:hypothetical protein